jgi:5-methyltetrahydrofolate--homocysteine methyltransferase
MSIPGLTIIGERLNPGFASSKAMLDAEDIPGLQKLAQAQARAGAHYLTINVGDKATARPGFLADLIRALQAVVDLPLSFDYPHRSVQELCLKTYDPPSARGRLPIVNSVTELRWDMVELRRDHAFRLVIMASERLENGEETPNRTAGEIAQTARRLVERVLNEGNGFEPEDLLIDVSLYPMASDTENLTQRALDAIDLIGNDPALRGVHQLVGLSNLGIMLPKFARDGSRLNVKLESAFLTLAVPRGLDTILGTPGRDYQLLPEDDYVLRGFKEAIALDGFDALLRLREIYQADPP